MSRGRPKPKLRDYSHGALTKEQQHRLLDAVAVTPQPITTAILGAVLVEHDLDRQIRRRLKHRDDATWLALVSDRGPLSSFSSKINLGFALGFYPEKVKEALDVVRTVRNAFAHSRQLIDFEDPLILKEIKSAKLHGKNWPKSVSEQGGRNSYAMLCMRLTRNLVEIELRSLKARARRKKRNDPARQAIVNALLGPLPKSEELNQEHPRNFLPYDPKNLTPLGLLGGLTRLVKREDEEGQ